MVAFSKGCALTLSNCFCLTRMWEDLINGAEELTVETVQREMRRLVDEVCSELYPSKTHSPNSLNFLFALRAKKIYWQPSKPC